MVSLVDRAGFALRQGTRIAWYAGHYFRSRRGQVEAARQSGVTPTTRPLPKPGAMMEDMGALFATDLANAESGLYPLPFDADGALLDRWRTSRRYFRDLASVERRRGAKDGREVAQDKGGAGLPDYYRQNFHYQTDGYLTDHSAGLYDMQVEVLFTGSANAMRRQALVPVREFVHGRDQRRIKALDLACGTGRFLRFFRQAYPRIGLHGLDLSEAYLAEAGRHMGSLNAARLICAKGEDMPFEDGSLDLVVTIFLFHELPRAIRRKVAREIARVLKPKGRLVYVDSLQLGDRPDYDGLLDTFDKGFHEPYFSTYVAENLDKLFGDAGLERVYKKRAFLSKVLAFEKA
jgi:ubiquinone/menaquinone biosynthesis C-methylase UbiE